MAEAINETLQATAASLLREPRLAPRFPVIPKNNGPLPDFDCGPAGYHEDRINGGGRGGAMAFRGDLRCARWAGTLAAAPI